MTPSSTARLYARLFFLFFAALWVAVGYGCAIKTPPVRIHEAVAAEASLGPGGREGIRLGVVPLTDQRPEEERRGRRPRGYYFLAWNSRIGTYKTGDETFFNSVAPDSTKGILKVLRSSQAFSEIRKMEPAGPVPLSAERVSALAKESGLDYLLRGEIRHFYGSQYQRAYFIPAFYVVAYSNVKREAIGFSSIRFELLSGKTGQVVWADTLSAEQASHQNTMSDMAVFSFSRVASDLAFRIEEAIERDRRAVSTRSDTRVPPRRVVRVKAVADERFRRDPAWAARMKNVFSEARIAFARQLGIELELVEIASWARGRRFRTLGGHLKSLIEDVPPGQADLVIAFTTPVTASRVPFVNAAYDSAGRAQYLGTHAIVAEGVSFHYRTTLLHELGHLFGAVHYNGKHSVMAPTGDSDRLLFDSLNRRIIEACHSRDFEPGGNPFAGVDLVRLVALYREALGLGERVDSGEIHTYLALAYAAAGQQTEGRESLERATRARTEREIVPSRDGGSHYNLGVLYEKRGDLDAAVEEYRKAIEENEGFEEAHFNLAVLLANRGEIEEAKRAFGRVLELNPGNRLAAHHLEILGE